MKDLFSAPCFAFSGSRSPSQKAIASLKKVLPLVSPTAPVSVGCADGVDQIVRSFFANSQSGTTWSEEAFRPVWPLNFLNHDNSAGGDISAQDKLAIA